MATAMHATAWRVRSTTTQRTGRPMLCQISSRLTCIALVLLGGLVQSSSKRKTIDLFMWKRTFSLPRCAGEKRHEGTALSTHSSSSGGPLTICGLATLPSSSTSKATTTVPSIPLRFAAAEYRGFSLRPVSTGATSGSGFGGGGAGGGAATPVPVPPGVPSRKPPVGPLSPAGASALSDSLSFSSEICPAARVRVASLEVAGSTLAPRSGGSEAGAAARAREAQRTSPASPFPPRSCGPSPTRRQSPRSRCRR